MPDYKRLKLDDIDVDFDLQPRAYGLDQDHVDELAEAYAKDVPIEPPTVWRIADQWDESAHFYRLSQGFHRFQAMRRAGLTEAKFAVRIGTADECVIDAACSNQGHGLKRTNADKRRAVEMLLKKLPKESDRSIADRAGVTDKTVAEVRRSLESTAEIPQSSTRTSKDGRERPASQPARETIKLTTAPGHTIEIESRDGEPIHGHPTFTPVNVPPPPGRSAPALPAPAPEPERETIVCPHCLGAGRVPKPPPVQVLYNAPGMPPVPAKLDTPEFLLSWESWLHERKKRKQPVTAKAATLQLRDLESHGVKIAIETIETSIKNGWTGLFPGKTTNGNGKARNFAAEAEADQMAQYAVDAFGEAS